MQPAAISEDSLTALVDRFYVKVRRDPLIGTVFNKAIADWPVHLDKLAGFWSSVMLSSGRYKGNPVAEHLKHVDEITPEMFERWLALWRETTVELFPPAVAVQLQAKADRIAESLQLAIRFRPGQQPLASPKTESAAAPAPAPYRSTPVFDQDSLPAALRSEHRTKEGVWGLIRILEGRVRLHMTDPDEVRELSPGHDAVVRPGQAHRAEPIGAMRMQIHFYDRPPAA